MKTIATAVISACLGAALAFVVASHIDQKAYAFQMHLNEASLAREQACRADLNTAETQVTEWQMWYRQYRVLTADPAGKADAETLLNIAAALLK